MRSVNSVRRSSAPVAGRKALERALEKSDRRNSLLLKEAIRMQEHLRHLSRRVLFAQEEERKRISRELHDEVGQILTGVTVRLATLKRDTAINGRGVEKQLASTQRLLQKTMRIVHGFARELRPPLLDDLGLIPALHAFMRQFTQRTCIPITFSASPAVERLNGDKRTVLYRVGQESLTNVARHAHASRIRVDIRVMEGDAHLEIHDDGRSFPVHRVFSSGKVTHLGLLGMRERVEMVGGVFTVESAPGQGTTVRAQVPMKNGRTAGGRLR